MQRNESHPMIEVYDSNNTEIKKLMDDKNRSAAYIANALIEEALQKRGIVKGVTLKL